MKSKDNSEINFPILKIYLPISFSWNLFLIICQLPFIILWYFYNDTILGEGLLVIPMIILYFYMRYHFTKKKYPHVNSLKFSNNQLYVPNEITKLNQDITINLNEIKEIKLTCFEKYRFRHPGVFKLIIYDIYNRVIEINALTISNIDKLIDIFKNNNLKVLYVYDKILFKIYIFLFILICIFFYYLYKNLFAYF